MAISLSNLVTTGKKIEVEFPGLDGFFVTLGYVSREELQKIRRESLEITFDKKTRQPVEEVDSEKFTDLYTRKTVLGWKGLKLKYLKELMVVELGELNEDQELEYSPEQALDLIKYSTVFDSWVSQIISDISNFNK